MFKNNHDKEDKRDNGSDSPESDAANLSSESTPETIRREGDGGPGRLQQDLEFAKVEASEWRDKFLRKLAEFDNYRKRTRQELEMTRQIAAESLVAGLLPVLDDFDRMLTVPGDAEDPYRKGAELIRGKLWSFLSAQGVEKMDALGKPFDPMQHDALIMQPTPGFPAHTVLNVIVPGYRIGERVVRHAQVVVSAEPEIEGSETDQESSGTEL